MYSGTGVQRVGAMASLVAALLCAALVPSAAFRTGPLALQWRPGACLDLKARQTAGSIPPLRCPLLSTAMSETSTDVGDVDQREWEQWTAKFAGKFVLRSGTATGTSRRAAIQSGFMLCHHVFAARASPALSSGLVHRSTCADLHVSCFGVRPSVAQNRKMFASLLCSWTLDDASQLPRCARSVTTQNSMTLTWVWTPSQVRKRLQS